MRQIKDDLAARHVAAIEKQYDQELQDHFSRFFLNMCGGGYDADKEGEIQEHYEAGLVILARCRVIAIAAFPATS